MSTDAVDARPFLRASKDSLWSKAEASADDFVATIKDELSKLGINAAVTRSPNGTHPITVRMDAWIPPGKISVVGRTVRRISLSITCRIHPFNRSKFTHDIGLSRDGREKGYLGLLNFTQDEARRWVRHAVGKDASNPRASENSTVVLMSMIGLAMLSPRYNPLDKQFRNSFPPPAPVILFLVGALVAIYGFVAMQGEPAYSEFGYYQTDPVSQGLPFFLIAIVLIAIAAFLSARRKRLVTVLDKPPVEPRFPRMVDAWNAVVPRLGDQQSIVRSRLFDAVSAKPIDRMQTSLETYAYFGADGYIEREQLVLRLGQALVHMHVYDFQDELFVGWDANLNLVRWVESAPQSVRVEDGMLNQFCTLEAGYHQINEYDIVDLNVITELVHRRLKDELQKILKERSIDEEIDFTIVRGAREGLVKKDAPGATPGSGTVLQRATRRFQRQH